MEDDGNGFTPAEREGAEHSGHHGLRILDDLLAEQGGTLIVRSQPHEGTTVEATFPA